MVGFLNVNEDELSVAPESVSAGRRLGFLGSFEAAYDEQVRYGSQFGAEVALRYEEQENIQRIRKAGGKPPKSLNDNEDGIFGGMTAGLDSAPYADYMRNVLDNNQDVLSSRLGGRDAELTKLKELYPEAGIRTYDEMFGDVRKKSDAARKENARPSTIPGMVGAFAGAAVGGLDPRTSPLSFLTLPVGAVGKTVFGRVASQGAGQGAIEAVAQLSGVRENQRLLGGDPSFLDSALAVGGAAVGGAALQGVGEGVGRALKWWRSTPTDPAPDLPAPSAAPPIEVVAAPQRPGAPVTYDEWLIRNAIAGRVAPPDLGVLGRRTTARFAAADLEHVQSRLDDWSGPKPWEIPPPTETRIPVEGRRPELPKTEVRSPGETVDDIARRIDPETFRIYDKLVAEKDVSRRSIDDFAAMRNEEVRASVADITAEIDGLKAKLPDATRRLAKKYEERIAVLEKERADKVTAATQGDSPAMIVYREQLMRADEKMRDLAPAVTRAYARAQGKWDVYEAQRREIADMMNEGTFTPGGGKPMSDFLPDNLPPVVPRTIADSIPELRTRLPNPDAPAVDTVRQVMTEQQKVIDDAIASYQKNTASLIQKVGDEALIEVEGRSIKLHLDKDTVTVPTLEGTGTRDISIRDLLKETESDNDMLKAVTTCSVGKTS